MGLLTPETQDKLLALLVDEGLVAADVIATASATSQQTSTPILTVLTEQKVIDDELLTHATAQVSGVPYVNLRNTIIDEKDSELIARRYCRTIHGGSASRSPKSPSRGDD